MQKRPIRADDLFRIAMVSDPQVSPDGTQVAFVVTRMYRKENCYRSGIWTVPVAGGAPRPLTAGTARDSTPRWSPDGRWLAFLSTRGGDKPQLWYLPADGGEARQLTNLPEGVEQPVWSPRGDALAFVSKVGPEKQSDSDVRVIRTIRYRFDGEGFLDDKYRQIWVVPFDPSNPSMPEARQITDGPYEHRDPAWSPTGHEIAFTAARHPDWELGVLQDIWAVSAAGGPPRKITCAPGAWSEPVWSPDGTTIALLGPSDYRRADHANVLVWTVPAGGGAPVPRTAALDRSAGDTTLGDIPRFSSSPVAWDSRGEAIHFLASDHGNTHLFRVSLADNRIERVIGGQRRVGMVVPIPGDAGFVFAASTPTSPGEIYACGPDGGNELQLTDVNREWLEEVELAEPEEIWATSPDGTRIQGWLLRPPGARPGVRYPMILQIHGGPHLQYGNGFMHEFQMLAGLGYAVLYSNPRGGTGYGEEFAAKLHAAWGEADMPDLMAIVDEAIRLGGIDEQRLGVTGGSYGGIMTNWVIGHTDRFKAAVTQRCCSNYVSMYGTDDISYSTSAMTFGAEVWEDPELYWRLSPITYVENIKTPLLIIHSEEDYRCPIEQAEQLFVSLKVLRRPVEFVRFPNESHGLSRGGQPRHRLERLEAIAGWFQRWL